MEQYERDYLVARAFHKDAESAQLRGQVTSENMRKHVLAGVVQSNGHVKEVTKLPQ